MKRALFFTVWTVLAASCSVNAVAPPAPQAVVSLDDVVFLARSDISDQTIFTFLDFRELSFVLDAENLLRLRESGVSEAVIRYLLEIDGTSSASAMINTVRTDYGATGYPAYYYGSRRFGSTVYPLNFYDHHYFGLGYTTIHRYGPHDSGSHSIGPAGGHVNNVSHEPIPVRHQNNLRHDIRHSSSNQSHGIRRVGSHASRPTVTHTSRHVGGHSSRHVGGHSSGHSGGHSGGHGRSH